MEDLVSAVRELRQAYGETQPEFAARAAMSVRTIVNYEKDRKPDPRALFQFSKLASRVGRADLAKIFSQAYQREIGDENVSMMDELHRSALTAVHENSDADWLEKQLIRLIRAARKGEVLLAYPVVLNEDETPNQEFRIEYLESLLVQLRMRTAASTEDLLQEMATERAEQTGETKERAYIETLRRYPELYARWNQERADAARGTRFEASLAVYGTRQHAARQRKQGRTTKKPSKK